MEDNLTQKLQSILEDPDMMRQIMSMASNLSESGILPPAGLPAMPDPTAVLLTPLQTLAVPVIPERPALKRSKLFTAVLCKLKRKSAAQKTLRRVCFIPNFN